MGIGSRVFDKSRVIRAKNYLQGIWFFYLARINTALNKLRTRLSMGIRSRVFDKSRVIRAKNYLQGILSTRF